MRDEPEDEVLAKTPKFSIQEMLRDAASKPGREGADAPEADGPSAKALPALDDLTPLPRPGDPYKAFARPQMKPPATLHCLMGDGSMRGFAWSGYDSIDWRPGEGPGEGPIVVVRFAGIFSREVAITGRHLEVLHHYLGTMRVAWIRVQPAGKILKDDGSSVITGMVIRHVDPEC